MCMYICTHTNRYIYTHVANNYFNHFYCILHGWIKGYNSSITTIMCQGGSYRTVVG